MQHPEHEEPAPLSAAEVATIRVLLHQVSSHIPTTTQGDTVTRETGIQKASAAPAWEPMAPLQGAEVGIMSIFNFSVCIYMLKVPR